MPTFPIKVHGKYVVWSTVVDQPVTSFVDSLEQLRLIAPGYVEALDEASLRYLESYGLPHRRLSDGETGEQRAAWNAAGYPTVQRADGGPPALSIDELLTAFADDEQGRQRAAKNMAAVDGALGIVHHAVEQLGGQVTVNDPTL